MKLPRTIFKYHIKTEKRGGLTFEEKGEAYLERVKFGINRGNPECIRHRRYIFVLLLALSFHWRNFKSPQNLWNHRPLTLCKRKKKKERG